MKNIENAGRLSEEKAQKEAKAIQGMSEFRSYEEGYKNPTAEHYEKSSKHLDNLKGISSKVAELFIEAAGLGKDLRDEMGPETHRIFEIAQRDIVQRLRLEGLFLRLGSEDPEEEKENMDYILSRWDNEIRSDERIKDVFLGKEELLNRTIEFTKKHTFQLLAGIKIEIGE